jgi:ABC-type nitrate/sulfonate/bicarbonate transport system substrate-binding protein
VKFAATALAVFLAITSLANPSVAQQKRDVTIGVGGAGFGSANVVIAKELGLFDKYGINAKTTVLDSSNAATTALISQSFDVAASGIGELIVARARGQDVVMIQNTYDGLVGTLVLSKAAAEKTGVSANAPTEQKFKALEGMVIATPSASSSYTLALKSVAAKFGTNIRLTFIGTDAQASALGAGAIQGYMSGAPTWAPPVVRGSGIVWLSGPRKEFPPENVPVNSGGLHVMRDFAEANKPLVKALAQAMRDFAKAIDERPADVKAAAMRAYPQVDPETMQLLFQTEVGGWRVKKLTTDDFRHDIEFVKLSNINLPALDTLDPSKIWFDVE